MNDDDLARLVEDAELIALAGGRVGIVGLTPIATGFVKQFRDRGLAEAIAAIYCDPTTSSMTAVAGIDVCPLQRLAEDRPDALVVASDDDKEALLAAALPYIAGTPKIVLAGYAHYEFRDPVFEEIMGQLLVPSLANGYRHSLVHLFQCLRNAARLRLTGVVAEFGMFKGGTTMFLSLASERLGGNWRVLGFDTFAGFPPRRSPLDMYDHAGCTGNNESLVRQYLAGRDVEVISGDIVTTSKRLASEDVVVAFVDTDNYTPAVAAIAMLRERVVRNGAIVFDHMTGDKRFRYTLGERIAASSLLGDDRYLNLHGTGVFFRQG